MKLPKKYCGKWRIEEMEQWDNDYIDLVVPGNLTLKEDETGSIQFGVVDADLDCRSKLIDDLIRIDFSFEGEEEGDPVCGRGWATVKGEKMTGRIFFHFGEESNFVASKK